MIKKLSTLVGPRYCRGPCPHTSAKKPKKRRCHHNHDFCVRVREFTRCFCAPPAPISFVSGCCLRYSKCRPRIEQRETGGRRRRFGQPKSQLDNPCTQKKACRPNGVHVHRFFVCAFHVPFICLLFSFRRMCVCLQRDGPSVTNEGNHNGCVVDPTASLDRLIHSTRSFREDAIASASALSLEVCFAAAANPELFTWIRGI